MRQFHTYRPLLLFVCGLVLGVSSESDSRTTLYIQGFVPTNNSAFNSEGIIPAATIAIDEINNSTELLADYRLHLEWRNTRCDPSEATWQLIQSVLDFPDSPPTTTKIFFLGGGCSLATEPTAALSGRFYNITQISYGASTPGLSDTTMFPKFFRTIPSETQSNSARFALMLMYDWSRVATLHETQNVFSLTVENFHRTYDNIFGNGNLTAEQEAEEEDENLILRSFTDDPEIPLRQIKEKDIRIILGYMYMDKAITTLCQAYHMNLTTDNHLWMLPAWYNEGWWNTTVGVEGDPSNKRCSPDQMRDAIRYSFFLDSYNFGNDSNATVDFSGLNNETFTQKYNEELVRFNANDPLASVDGSVPHSYRTFTYDAVYAIALALNRTAMELKPMNLTLDDFAYNNSNGITNKIVKNMKLIDFNGISGRVTFDANGTRMGLNGIYQLRDDTPDGTLQLKLIAVHDPGPEGTNYDFEFDIQPIFKGGRPPRDRRTPVNIYLNEALVITGAVFVTLAIIVAIGLLVFNLVTIRMPLIADSAPHINTVIIVGCILMLGACYLLGIDSANPDADNDIFLTAEEVNQSTLNARNDRYASVCTARLWLLTLGFTLSFGALFGKTWQVYRVYTNHKLKKEPFKMWNFLIMLSIFLVIDFLYLIAWSAAAPFRRETETQETSNDRIEVYEECACNGFSYLIGILYVYKGLQVVFGLFLAYESRNVKYFYINDSRFVSIAMYIVVILVGIGAPLSLVLAVNFIIDPAYALAVFMIIATCMSCLLILFVPKFIYMAKGKDTMIRETSREEVTVSDGLQLGKSTVDQTDVQHAESQVNDLKQQVAERSVELQELKGQEEKKKEEPPKNRMGSDADSGILMTGDTNEHETTSSELEQQRENNTTPPSLASAEVVAITDGTDL